MEAASESAVTGKLRAQGLTPLDITALSKTGLNREIKLPGFGGTVKAKSLAIFTRQMAGLLNAGLPLMRTLAILIEQTEDKKLQPALVAVQADIEAGQSFSNALARHPDVFPPLFISIVRVGETGGFLARAMHSLAENYQKEAELQNKIRAAVTYPIDRAHHRDPRRPRDGDVRRAGVREHVRRAWARRCRCRRRSS